MDMNYYDMLGIVCDNTDSDQVKAIRSALPAWYAAKQTTFSNESNGEKKKKLELELNEYPNMQKLLTDADLRKKHAEALKAERLQQVQFIIDIITECNNSQKSITSRRIKNIAAKIGLKEVTVKKQFRDAGYEIRRFTEPADVFVINTCTVTAIADKKSRQMLHRAKKKNPDAVIAALGCYVQTSREDLEKDSGVDILIGNDEKDRAFEIIDAWLREYDAQAVNEYRPAPPAEDLPHPAGELPESAPVRPKGLPESASIRSKELFETEAERERVYVKISDDDGYWCGILSVTKGEDDEKLDISRY